MYTNYTAEFNLNVFVKLLFFYVYLFELVL